MGRSRSATSLSSRAAVITGISTTARTEPVIKSCCARPVVAGTKPKVKTRSVWNPERSSVYQPVQSIGTERKLTHGFPISHSLHPARTLVMSGWNRSPMRYITNCHRAEIFMTIFNETYTLANDVRIPKLGLGTWFIYDDQAAEAVRTALELGYRNID